MVQSEIVPIKERCFLEQDPEINGQKYFCVSFISPEDILVQKDVFFFNRFLSKFAEDMNVFFTNTKDKFKDDQVVTDMLDNLKERHGYVFDGKELQQEVAFFKDKNNVQLESEFEELQGFRTTMRGIKIRGVYPTEIEARHRAEKLAKQDPAFNIYIGSVGCWCPWNPAAEGIEDKEWTDTQLNTLMKKYKDGEDLKHELYRMRKDDLLNKASQQKGPIVVVEDDVEIGKDGVSNTVSEANADLMQGSDPWLEAKKNSVSSD